MKRSFKFIGAVLLTLVIVVCGLAWYVASLPWRNACAAPLTNAATEPTNTAVATSQPLATAAAATILRHGGTAVDAAIAAAIDPKATFEPQRNCPLPFLQQSLREQRELCS